MREARPLSLAELIARAVAVAVLRIEARRGPDLFHAPIIPAPRPRVSRKPSRRGGA